MYKFFYYLILLFGLMQFYTVKGQELQTLTGRTLSVGDAEIVQLVSILNVNTGKKYISNRQGYFKLFYQPNDTILFTAIGYDNLRLVTLSADKSMADDTILILLKSKVVKLKEFRVVSSNPKRDSIARAAAEFLKTDPLMNNYDRVLNRERGSIMSPLTALYQQFSSEGKNAVRFEEFMAYMEKQKRVDRKYNRNMVKRATNLPEIQLEEFMGFCMLDKDFVIEASEYDLIKAIQNCLPSFNALRNK